MNKQVEYPWFEIDVASTTYRTYQIKAESPSKACEIAMAEMDADWEISKAWKQNAEVVSCDPFSYDENGHKVVGTQGMSDEEFGNYIKNS
jgi:hypothetical protein|tara:strand:+ start:423 stop:692 length:270 start_codon:yes stop_codon:yes gene_type:complete